MACVWGTAWLSLLFCFGGCAKTVQPVELPSRELVTRDQLIVHSDFHVPKSHRLLDELAARRNDVANLLGLPLSDEPIHVYLFEDQKRYDAFLEDKHPAFPDRRAFFVKTDTELKVYAFWGERIAEDLRHEVTHGYLHSTIPNLPIWLDEGIAEYFETPRGKNGFNQAHVYQLASEFRRDDWEPDLKHLESLQPNDEMTQIEYAEAWLWVHFLVHHNSETREILRKHLQALHSDGSGEAISVPLEGAVPDAEVTLLAHLRQLAEKM